MKTTLIAVLALVAINLNAGLKVNPAPSQTIHAGDSIPVSFSATGFPAGSTAQIWLVSVRDWQPFDIIKEVPVAPGLNTAQCDISWSWSATGKYVVRVAIGNIYYTGNTTYTIRSAVLWPYPGWTYPKDSDVWVTWNTAGPIIADSLDIYLYNEDTGEFTGVAGGLDPGAGRAQFHTPNVIGSHFRLVLNGYLNIPEEDETGAFIWQDLSEITNSGLLRIE